MNDGLETIDVYRLGMILYQFSVSDHLFRAIVCRKRVTDDRKSVAVYQNLINVDQILVDDWRRLIDYKQVADGDAE